MLRKYVIAWLHKMGLNQHAYWTGSTWTPDLKNAVWYPTAIDAEQIIESLPNRVNLTFIRVDVPWSD